jgi:hypothetical protein
MVAIDPQEFGYSDPRTAAMQKKGDRNERMLLRALGVDAPEKMKTTETLKLSTWAQLAMLAEAVDTLASDPSATAIAAVKAARAQFPGWLVANATAQAGKKGWRRWEKSAKKFAGASGKFNQIQDVRKATKAAADAALAAVSPAATVKVSGVASAVIASARNLLKIVRSGRMVRKIKVAAAKTRAAATGRKAAAAAGAAAGVAAAATGAAGATGGAAAAKAVFAPGGMLDIPSWSIPAKIAAALVAIGVGAKVLKVGPFKESANGK